MAYASRYSSQPCRSETSRLTNATKPGVLERLFGWLSRWEEAQRDRQIGRLLAQSGGRISDDFERKMMRCATRSMWGPQG